MIDFTPFPKIARLNRQITVTEKLDGTNAAVVIVQAYNVMGIGAARADQARRDNPRATILEYRFDSDFFAASKAIALVGDYAVFAQSRTRFITPGDDNYGFAAWVRDNAKALVETLGEGTHFGEWWGAGIQRKYGGHPRTFSLFNTSRWTQFGVASVPSLDVVPVLYSGVFDSDEIYGSVSRLWAHGSYAAPGFMRPEGIVIWHEAARQLFKVTLEGDEAPKGAEGHALDVELAA